MSLPQTEPPAPSATPPLPVVESPTVLQGASLAHAVERLELAAALLTSGVPALGLLRGLRIVVSWYDHGGGAGLAAALLDALFVAGLWALAGVTGGALVRVLGRGLLLRATLPATAPTGQVPPVAALMAPSQGAVTAPAAHAPGAIETLREEAFVEVRHAIRSGEWDEARRKLDALAEDRADRGRLEGLNRELQAAREATRAQHLAGLQAARSVNDPDRVLELHQSLVPLLEDEARLELEAELSGWFLRLIHHRLRSGRIQADLAQLASRIAESFSHTTEGASLRASLPTLRRSAGLCPRCAQPYTGLADACPACLTRAHTPVAPAPEPPPEPSPGDSWLNASM